MIVRRDSVKPIEFTMILLHSPSFALESEAFIEC